jgi:hypothetical protein
MALASLIREVRHAAPIIAIQSRRHGAPAHRTIYYTAHTPPVLWRLKCFSARTIAGINGPSVGLNRRALLRHAGAFCDSESKGFSA